MTDYEKLLEKTDDLIEGLRDPKIAHYAVGRAACTIDDARDIVPRLAAALREVMAERDGTHAALTTETRNANAYAHERDTMRSERDAADRAHEAAEARLVVVERERDAALADVEAMRAALSDAATALEQASNDLTIDSRNDMRHQRGAVATVELSLEGLAAAALDAMVAAERAKSALDARATPSAKETK